MAKFKRFIRPEVIKFNIHSKIKQKKAILEESIQVIDPESKKPDTEIPLLCAR